MSEYKCYKCGYEWEQRVEKPKSCPRCKRRFDYHNKEKNDELQNAKSSKRLW